MENNDGGFVLIVRPEDFERFKTDDRFKDCNILLNDGTVRPDLYDGEKGGIWLTKRGTLRKRLFNKSSRVF